MGNISGQTIEDFVYQNGNLYFSGKLVKVDGVPSKLAGGLYRLSEDNTKSFVGQLNIVYSLKKQVNFSLQNIDDYSDSASLAGKIIDVIK
jgi:hypothetical protein